jgi:hydroxymethylpyrimidine pyrophosphatase-like HAD family hydrolase
VKALYVDLDGTLLGPGGSLLAAADGGTTLLGVRAIEACVRAGVEVVIVSARGSTGVAPIARALGARSYVYEAGAAVVLDGEEHWLTGDLLPHEEHGTVFAQIEATGAPALLLEHFAGRLEEHTPWNVDREVSHLLRGSVDAFEADALLAAHGHEGLRLIDNGVLRSADDPGSEQVRAYHLVPAVVSKAAGVAFHQRARGYAPQDCIAVGDSREDLGMAPAVGTFWLVANGLARDPAMGAALREHANVRVAEGAHGAGVYEAVVTTLALRGQT